MVKKAEASLELNTSIDLGGKIQMHMCVFILFICSGKRKASDKKTKKDKKEKKQKVKVEEQPDEYDEEKLL